MVREILVLAADRWEVIPLRASKRYRREFRLLPRKVRESY